MAPRDHCSWRPFHIALVLLQPNAVPGLPTQVRPAKHEVHHRATTHDAARAGVEAVELGARGDMVRKEADHHGAGTVPEGTPLEGAGVNEVVKDGQVSVVNPAMSESERLKLQELSEECMFENPTSECMEKYGSYGVRKMFTETWEHVKKLKYLRPGWMSHPAVQKKRLFDLTFPATVNSGSYAISNLDAPASGMVPFGVLSQSLDVYKQLQMGVRMFDLKVGYSVQASLVYVSHGALMVPLATVLKDIKRFVQENSREVIVLDVRKDENADAEHLKPLIEEESSNTRIPGQLVHEAMECEFKQMLATYEVLDKLPGSEFAENPTISALTDLGANIVYFWHNQQVLCTSFEKCLQTPGWFPADSSGGHEFAFGPPFPIGKRVNVTGGRMTARMIEPACNAHSSFFTKDPRQEKGMMKLKLFSENIRAKIEESRPRCYPLREPIPEIHTPTLFYTLDAFTTPSSQEQAQQDDRMRGVKAIYTRGEGFTVRSESERMDYLLLSWYMKKGNQEKILKPNAVSLEFASAGAAAIIRLIEANQARPDCGFAIYCKDSGSCWADTLLGGDDKCLAEADVLKKLEEHANGKSFMQKYMLQMTLCITACVGLCFLSGALRSLRTFSKEEPNAADEGLQDTQDVQSEPDSLPDHQPESALPPSPQTAQPATQSASGGGFFSSFGWGSSAPAADDEDAP